MSTRAQIEEFLQHKRLAVAGVSRKPRHFSRVLFRELLRRGYEAAPVNPEAREVEGIPCYARVQDVQPTVEAVLIMTPPKQTEQVVRDCAEAGVKIVWMYRAVGSGAVSQSAIDFCEERGLRVIAGFCPYMFLPEASFGHRLHGVLLKLTGRYPS